MRAIKGQKKTIAIVLFRMGLASLARSLSHVATIQPTAAAAITTMTRTTSACGCQRFCVAAFRPTVGARSKLSYSLYASSLQSSPPSSESDSVGVSPQFLTPHLSPLDENYFLNQVEVTISKALGSGRAKTHNDVQILDLPVEQREPFGVAKNVDKRLRSLRKNNDCPRCWMQRYHCICEDCGPVVDCSDNRVDKPDALDRSENPLGSLKRIFLVVHHKEIGLKVDTAKLILAAFPFQCELVVGGIGPEYQKSMKEMLESIQDSERTSLLLFPDETAETLEEIVAKKKRVPSANSSVQDSTCSDDDEREHDCEHQYDLIVLDGTWAQARKFHSRYFSVDSSSLQRVKLSEASVELLHEGSIESGHQLRRHEIPWRQVGTFEAFRLFLRDWSREFPSHNLENGKPEFWEQIESYQRISNEAALRELGPPRS